jgi:hypothetical protein
MQKQLSELTAGRGKYEADLREQLFGARADQVDAAQKQADAIQRLRKDQATLETRYAIARMQATTAAQKLQVDKIYKAESLGIRQQALAIQQQNANTGVYNSETSRINALTGGANGGLTPTGTLVNNQKAADAAEKLFTNGSKPDAATPIIKAPVNYQDAIRRLRQDFKIPLNQALALLNRHYDTPGQDGRPLLDYTQRAKLSKAKKKTFEKIAVQWKRDSGRLVESGDEAGWLAALQKAQADAAKLLVGK